jgi:hypothetical protein
MSRKIYETKAAADAAKRFRMLCEYSFNITEDDGEEVMDNPNEGEGNMPQMDAPDAGMKGDDMPPEQNMGQDDTNMDMNGMGETPEEGGGAPGFNPEDNISNETPDMDGDIESEPMQDGDEVIDIDELTQSQEETEEKVDDIQVSMEKGFDKLLNVVDKLNTMIDASTAHMEQIKQEIEKRNPTPIEKLNMRAANDSYPFNVSPSDYWKSKEASSNYRIGGDDEDGDAEQYTITQGDIDKMTDFRAISKDLDDSEFNQNLLNIFGLR